MNQWVGALAGVVVGWFLNIISQWLRIRFSCEASWLALESEVELCCTIAKTFLNDAVPSPLYRLPMFAYEHSFPILLREGDAKADESVAIARFFLEVDTLNRGFDQIQETRGGRVLDLPAEYQRARIKAERIVTEGPLYQELRTILDRHTKKA